MEDIASVVVSTKVSLLTLGTWTQGLQYSLRVCVCVYCVCPQYPSCCGCCNRINSTIDFSLVSLGFQLTHIEKSRLFLHTTCTDIKNFHHYHHTDLYTIAHYVMCQYKVYKETTWAANCLPPFQRVDLTRTFREN